MPLHEQARGPGQRVEPCVVNQASLQELQCLLSSIHRPAVPALPALAGCLDLGLLHCQHAPYHPSVLVQQHRASLRAGQGRSDEVRVFVESVN